MLICYQCSKLGATDSVVALFAILVGGRNWLTRLTGKVGVRAQWLAEERAQWGDAEGRTRDARPSVDRHTRASAFAAGGCSLGRVRRE